LPKRKGLFGVKTFSSLKKKDLGMKRRETRYINMQGQNPAMYLVTGGAGFIGSHIADALDAKETLILDDFSAGKMENIGGAVSRGAKLLRADIASITPETLKGVDVVFHEAALVSVPLSFQKFDKTYRDNVASFLNLLECARKADTERVVFASSAAVYDEAGKPVAEGAPLFPRSPYAESKLIDELYARIYAKEYGMAIVPLRYFNVYGPRQDPSSPYSGVISIFASSMSSSKQITIYGDGNQTRDFIHVSDVAEANLLAVRMKGHSAEPINIASGKGTTILGLFRAMAEITGYGMEPSFAEGRPGDARFSVADTEKAESLLDFSAKRRLEEGLRETLKAFQGIDI
jgi:UDP-glucose 4-epimerase